MKTLFPKKIFTMFFFIVCLTINAQVHTNAITKEKEPTPPTANPQILIGIAEPIAAKGNITGVLNVQIEGETLKGLSYQLYSYSGKLIKSSPINKNITEINLHNVESENYVLNIVKGNENVKTFGFYH